MNKPLKRHEALQPLSRDHHQGLLLGWRIRQGIKKKVDQNRIFEYFRYFWKEHLEPHFQLEEAYIFNLLDPRDEMRIKAEDQHRELREIEMLLEKKGVERDLLDLFADKLEAHIRYEERELFQYMQKVLGQNELATLNEKMEKVHSEKSECWNDPFWVK
ncbi:hemerythrin domain-containing protein [Echinicola jeungdonensis]|uniref:Hemerythrin domain-containing protein n=1 Tax=Echinicola jeungdonensis TaxID=709343 RepID=A0ABV5J380_9BACT|nr:hemerythrin domain-containing protein [Echinicola jeungdonensis]MDN3670693.1 hemerythrin domain-containing protein [Echinicola jeungdonensis]